MIGKDNKIIRNYRSITKLEDQKCQSWRRPQRWEQTYYFRATLKLRDASRATHWIYVDHASPCITCSTVQKMWASSCWKRRTRVKPLKVPDNSFLWSTPKSANLIGISLHDRGRWANIRLEKMQQHTAFTQQRKD